MLRPEKDTQEEAPEFFMTVTMTTGRYGRKRDYQSTTFVQNFTDQEMQILAMQKLFPAVTAAIGTEMTKLGNEGIQLLKQGQGKGRGTI